MRVSRCSVLVAGLNLILLTLCLWPMFVVISAASGYFLADGELLANFQNQPKRLLLEDFIDGFLRTLPYAAAMAFIAVLWQIFLRKNILFLLIGGMIAGFGLIAAILFYIPATFLNALVFVLLMLCFLALTVMSGYLFSWCGHA